MDLDVDVIVVIHACVYLRIWVYMGVDVHGCVYMRMSVPICAYMYMYVCLV